MKAPYAILNVLLALFNKVKDIALKSIKAFPPQFEILQTEKFLIGRKKQFELLNDKSSNLHTPYVFFDRGIHDIYAYLKAIGQESKSWYDRISEYQYDLVFLLTPWEAIYRQDEQRTETFEEASNYFSFIEATYRDAHKVIYIPQRSVAERIAFVKDTLKQYE